MKAASCFSGIGGAELALPEAEWLWCAEIEKFPSAVLAHRFGHPNLGDVTAPDFIERARSFGRLDLLAGGPPCQAFSIAGLRRGMLDPRGLLSLRFIQVAHELSDTVGLGNLLVENVPGWLSHKENAFGCFLGGLVGADDALPNPAGGSWPRSGMVAGPRARAAWRVLDAQYAGLAQRRERVLLVADFGNGADPASVLFERKSLSGGDPPSRETRKDVTGTLSARTEGGGGLGTDFDLAGGLQPVVNTLDASYGRLQGCAGQDANHGHSHLVPELAHTLRGEGFDASEDGSGKGTPLIPVCVHADAIGRSGDAANPSVDAAGRARLRDAGMGVAEDIAFGLTTDQPHAVAFRTTGNDGAYETGDQIGALTTSTDPNSHIVAFSIMPMNSGKDYKARETDIAQPLMAGGPVGGNQGGDYICQTVAYDLRNATGAEVAQTLSAGGMGDDRGLCPNAIPHVVEQWAVRRLTVTECCRLQGYPDDWTMIEFGSRRTVAEDEAAYLTAKGAHVALDNKGKLRTNAAADGPQYKALGNAWAVDCVRPVALRIKQIQGDL